MPTLKRNAAGKVLRTSGGKLATSCAVAPGADCAFCAAGHAPANFTVVVSGVSPCNGAPDVNGTYVLAQDGADACLWRTPNGYPDCTGMTGPEAALIIQSGPQFLFAVYAPPSGCVAALGCCVAFNSGWVNISDCLISQTVNNTQTSCASAQGRGAGGTAVIAPGP